MADCSSTPLLLCMKVFAMQVYGLLTTASQWWFYRCAPGEKCPVQAYQTDLLLMRAKAVSQIKQATRELLQDLPGFLKLCVHDAKLNMSGVDAK